MSAEAKDAAPQHQSGLLEEHDPRTGEAIYVNRRSIYTPLNELPPKKYVYMIVFDATWREADVSSLLRRTLSPVPLRTMTEVVGENRLTKYTHVVLNNPPNGAVLTKHLIHHVVGRNTNDQRTLTAYGYVFYA